MRRADGSEIVAIIIVVSASSYMMAIYILKTILPFIAFGLGASDILVARILYIGFIMFIFVPPIAGYLSDVMGYRKTIAVATIAESALILAYNLATNYSELLIIRVLQAFFGTVLSASFLHVSSIYARKTGVYIGYLRFAQAMGMALGSLIVALFPGFTEETLIIIATILCLAPLLSILLGEIEESEVKVRRSYVFRYVLRRDLLYYYLCALANIVSISIMFSYVVSYMIEQYRLTRQIYATILFLATTIFGMSSIVASKLCDRAPRGKWPARIYRHSAKHIHNPDIRRLRGSYSRTYTI